MSYICRAVIDGVLVKADNKANGFPIGLCELLGLLYFTVTAWNIKKRHTKYIYFRRKIHFFSIFSPIFSYLFEVLNVV